MGFIHEYNISAVEMVQRWTTHWVKSDYYWESSVIVMLCDLQWSILHSIEKFNMKTFHIAIYSDTVLIILDYFMATAYATCHQLPVHFVVLCKN